MKQVKYIKIILISLFFAFAISNSSESITELSTREVAGNFRTIWELTWGPDGYLWATERFGRISRINPETGETFHLITIDEVYENGERGMMGMALHPEFSDNPYVYVVYNTGTNNQNTRIKIVQLLFDGTKLSNPIVLLDNIKGWWNHNGSRIKIGTDNKLWFTIGDAADISLPQKLDNINGKLCRMNLDGSIPDDNPFPGSMIWSYGHRNQQGLVIVDDKIYTSEHGASTDDEINLIVKGGNYGWPQVEGFCNKPDEIKFCEENNVVEPILSVYPNYTIAASGIDYYNHDLISEWKNSLIMTSLKAELIVIAKLDDSRTKVISSEEIFKNKFGRLRDLCVAPDGRVFIGTSNQDGRASGAFQNSFDKIIEIKPLTSGINNLIDKKDNIVFPNPFVEFLSIKLEGDLLPNEIIISDFMGRNVGKIDHPKSGINTWKAVDNTGNKLPNGIYSLLFDYGISKVNKIVVLTN